jgi:hypothetical protein
LSSQDSGEEIVVGIHESGIELQEGLNTSVSRNYCANCKRNTHCFVKIDQDTKEAIIENNCTNETCRCNCRTKYACKSCGNLHPYGKNCDRVDTKPIANPKADREIFEINAQWNELQSQKKQNMPGLKKYD